jgi:hypothetical protein
MFEEWALSPETCSPEEREALQQHRQQCESCDRLARSWKRIESVLDTAPFARPAEGFAQRFQQNLAARKAAAHKRQARKFLLILGITFAVSILAGSVYFYSINPPQFLLTQVFRTAANVLVTVENIKIISSTFLGFTPGAIFLPILMVSASALGGFALLWFTAIWKFTLHGEKAQ